MAEVDKSKTISLADIEQLEDVELQGYHGEADANAGLPPLPKGLYHVTVTFPGDSNEAWISKTGATGKNKDVLYFMAKILLTTSANPDESTNNRTIFYNAMTMVTGQQGTTSAQALLQGLDIDTTLLTTHKKQMLALSHAIEGGQAHCYVELDWEGQIYDKEFPNKDGSTGKTLFRVRGQGNFPRDAEGNPIPLITAADGRKDVDGNQLTQDVPAQNSVKRFKTLDQGAAILAKTEEEDKPVENTPLAQTQTVKTHVNGPASAPKAPAGPRAPAPPPAGPTRPTAPTRR